MIPNLTLFVEPLSNTSFELCFFEVKRPGNTTNGHLENDLVKLEKEMQAALTKLVLQRVESPEVVGVLVEGNFLFYTEYCSTRSLNILNRI